MRAAVVAGGRRDGGRAARMRTRSERAPDRPTEARQRPHKKIKVVHAVADAVADAAADAAAGGCEGAAEGCEGVAEECKSVTGESECAALVARLLALKDEREVLNGQVSDIKQQLEELEEAGADQAVASDFAGLADVSTDEDGFRDEVCDAETVAHEPGRLVVDPDRLHAVAPAIRASLLMHALVTCFDDVLLHLSTTVDGQAATLAFLECLISGSSSVGRAVENFELPDSDELVNKSLLDRVRAADRQAQ